MKPVEGNDDFCETPGGSGLKTPASSVIWTGPDIPCIELCSGDTIDKVIYDIAMILCDITDNVLDVSKLDFQCLLSEGACLPDTLLETLQIMINKSCGLNPDGTLISTGTDGGIVKDGNLPMVSLPECLWFKNAEGDTIKSLKLDAYASYLATSMCKIITDVTSINSKINTLNNQITTLTATVGGGGSGTGGSGSSSTIMSKCLSAPTPGQNINLTTAFQNLEESMCSYIQLIGQTTDWNSLIGDECITLNTDLPDDSGKYGDIVGWYDDPQSVYESMSNLWKVVCKLNEVQTAGGGTGGTGGTGACTKLAVPSVTYSAASATISWGVPSSVVDLNAYSIQIKDQTTGAVIHSATVPYPGTSYDLPTTSGYTDGVPYNINVIAQYDCGDAPATITPVAIATTAIEYRATLIQGAVYIGGEDCNCTPSTTENPCRSVFQVDHCEDEMGFPYGSSPVGVLFARSQTLRVVLSDPVTGIQKPNATSSDIIIRLCYKVRVIEMKTSGTCSEFNNNNLITSEFVDIRIPPGQSEFTKTIERFGRKSDRSCRRYTRDLAGFKGIFNSGLASITNVAVDPSTIGLLTVC